MAFVPSSPAKPRRVDIAIRIKAEHADAAIRILRAKGHPPVEIMIADNGSVLLRFGKIGDDISYQIAGALPLDYYDLRVTGEDRG